MERADKAIQFLRELGRGDLAALLRFSTYQFVEEELWFDINVPTLEISSPQLYNEVLRGLPEWDKKRVAEAITAKASKEDAQAPGRVLFKSIDEFVVPESDTLYPEIFIHKNQMIAVATGQERIQDVNDYYRARHRRIAGGLAALSIENPNQYGDLWGWYRKWRADLSSYADRRQYVNEMYQQLLESLADTPPPAVPPREPTGWERVDRALEKARTRFTVARHEEDFQTVGLLCREILISLGQAVFDPKVHKALDGVGPSETDAGRMIEAFLSAIASGGSNDNVRKHARAALQLAVQLQHKRTADFRAAALCLEATSSITNIIAILCGRRDPEIT